MSDVDDDPDLTAGEYAMGVLEGEDLASAEARMRTDPDFVRAVEAWRARLSPLASLASPVAPPAALWARIAAATDQEVDNVVPLRRVRVWQVATAGSLALAASLAAFMLIRQPAPPRIAVLAPMAGGAPVLIATLTTGDTVTIRPNSAIAVPADRDLELWSLPAGASRPRSLGVLPAAGKRLTADLATGGQLLVSLEPRGGSPTGQPTGPVLYGGVITITD